MAIPDEYPEHSFQEKPLAGSCTLPGVFLFCDKHWDKRNLKWLLALLSLAAGQLAINQTDASLEEYSLSAYVCAFGQCSEIRVEFGASLLCSPCDLTGFFDAKEDADDRLFGSPLHRAWLGFRSGARRDSAVILCRLGIASS